MFLKKQKVSQTPPSLANPESRLVAVMIGLEDSIPISDQLPELK
jgi:hypothetical protein